MKLLKVELPDNHEIGFAGCFHFGNGHQHIEGIQQYVDWLKGGKNRYGFLLGDIAEAIHKSDKRHEDALHKNTILDQYADAVDMFKPVKRKLLGSLAGNHDWKINSYGDFVDYNFSRPLGIPYCTYSSRILVYTPEKKLQYKIFATHGNGSVNSTHADPIMREAAEKSQVKRKLARERNTDCILNVIAHFHKSIIVAPYNELHMIDNQVEIKQKYHVSPSQTASFIPVDQRYYLAVPGFVRKYGVGGQSNSSSYVERAGMSPVELGFITVSVKNTLIIKAEKIFV